MRASAAGLGLAGALLFPLAPGAAGAPASMLADSARTPALAVAGRNAGNPPGPPSITTAVPGLSPGAATVTVGDLASVSAQVNALTARANAANTALATASAHEALLRMTYDNAVLAQESAQRRLAKEVRRAYENYQVDPLSTLLLGLSPDGLHAANLAERNAVGVDGSVVASLDKVSRSLVGLRRRLDAVRQRLLGPALAAESALEQAEGLLSFESIKYGEQRAVAAQQARVAALSAQLTSAVAVTATPVQLATAAAQAPILAALVAAGAQLPAGFIATNASFTGVASWYGPGFIGSPTASGAPYDPQQLTCAMLAVPLDTVVHVSTGTHAVNCLVNDRGPYVGGRIIDMSEAGAAALAYAGIAQVTVTVLRPR